MLEDFYMINYGINDLSTPNQIEKLSEKVEDKIFVEKLLEIVSSPITNIESYKDNLRVKVILEYIEYLTYIKDDKLRLKLEKFYGTFNKNDNNKIKGKVLSFINSNFELIWTNDDYEIKNLTLDWILSFGGFKKWDVLADKMGSMRNLCINRFDGIYSILKKYNKDLIEDFIEKVLIPIETQFDFKTQVDIYKIINKTSSIIGNKFEEEVMKYIESEEFLNLHPYNKKDILSYIFESDVFCNENKIKIQTKLDLTNEEVDKEILKSGTSFGVTPEIYQKIEENIPLFREKLYFLVSDSNNSIYRIIYDYNFEKKSIMDFIGTTGIGNEKYGNAGFVTNLDFYEIYIIVSTKYILLKYKDKFWKELCLLIEDVEELVNITKFMLEDMETIKILIEHKKYFLICTLLTQVIERLLREIYLRITYNTVGFFKNINNPTLGNLLDYKNSDNILLDVFDIKELEALHYFLCNKKYGKNLRNILAHYTIKSDDIREDDFIQLLHILIFILIKIYYKGIVFDIE